MSPLQIKHFLFRRGHTFGQDLRSIDITRARDHGLASYNDIREQCGMKRAKTWDCLEKDIPKYLISRLKTLYETPEDIELVIGGALEFPIGDSTVGPTFTCIIANQFLQIRVGDRFFFENDGSEDQTGFSIDQLKEIKKASIARIYCDHVNNLQRIQGRAFELNGYG
jgi:peroxidase